MLTAYLRSRNYAPDSVSLGNLRVLVQWRSKVKQTISSLSTKTTYSNVLSMSLFSLIVAFSNEFLKDADGNIGKEHFLYKLILDKRVKCSFPNVDISLRMYLILMVTNFSGERSFSMLKYIKNRLREHDILRETDFDDLITDFAKRKCRTVSSVCVAATFRDIVS